MPKEVCVLYNVHIYQSKFYKHDVVECVYRDSSMNLASSVSPMATSTSVNVFQVTGCFPLPRIHRFRISRVMVADL